MRDGTKLRASKWLPKDFPNSGNRQFSCAGMLPGLPILKGLRADIENASREKIVGR